MNAVSGPRKAKVIKNPSRTKAASARGAGAKTPGVGLRVLPVEPETIYGRMGRLLGKKFASEADVVKGVNDGLPPTALTRLVDEVHVELRMIGAETTIRRRIQEQQDFTVEESERLVRFARVTSMAEALFGDRDAAVAWLNTRAVYVANESPLSPLELATTDPGARMVESMLARTEHGIF